MPEALAISIWIAVGAYALVGALVALWLVFFGFSRFDSNAATAPFALKLLWLPGCMALWPILLRRASGASPPEDRT